MTRIWTEPDRFDIRSRTARICRVKWATASEVTDQAPYYHGSHTDQATGIGVHIQRDANLIIPEPEPRPRGQAFKRGPARRHLSQSRPVAQRAASTACPSNRRKITAIANRQFVICNHSLPPPASLSFSRSPLDLSLKSAGGSRPAR